MYTSTLLTAPDHTPRSPSRRTWMQQTWRLATVLIPVAVLLLTFLHHSGYRSTTQTLPSFSSATSFSDRNAKWHHTRRRRKRWVSSTADGASSTLITTTFTALPTTAQPSSTGSSASAATIVPPVPVTPPPLPTPFPQPFDVSLGFNFSTAGCAAFFTNLTLSTSFRECRPFSLLLSTSAAFFQAQTNLTLLSDIIYGTCNTKSSSDDCDAVMAYNVEQLNSVCALDLKARNSIAIQALNGFLSYTEMRLAACLENTETNTYCYVDAVAASSPSDVYYYSLPLGTPLPKGTVPTCSDCTQSLMNVYANFASNKSLPISETYNTAAQFADAQCGMSYVQTFSTSGAYRSTLHGTHGLSSSLLVLLAQLAIASILFAQIGGFI